MAETRMSAIIKNLSSIELLFVIASKARQSREAVQKQ